MQGSGRFRSGLILEESIYWTDQEVLPSMVVMEGVESGLTGNSSGLDFGDGDFKF